MKEINVIHLQWHGKKKTRLLYVNYFNYCLMFADLTADTDCLCSAPCNLDTYVHPTPYIVQQRTDSICILYDSSVVKLRENCFRVFVNIDRLDKIGRTTFSTVVNSENLSPTIFRHSSMVDMKTRCYVACSH